MVSFTRFGMEKVGAHIRNFRLTVPPEFPNHKELLLLQLEEILHEESLEAEHPLEQVHLLAGEEPGTSPPFLQLATLNLFLGHPGDWM